MTVWRWRTGGVPASLAASGQPVCSAWMPAVTKSAVTWLAYKDHVDGQPGTRAIPAPNNGIPSSPLLLTDHRSSDAPPVWYPSVYYQHTPFLVPAVYPAGGNDSGVCIYSDNQLPVPAVDPTRGTYRLGGGEVVQPYQETYQQPKPRQGRLRRVMARHA